MKKVLSFVLVLAMILGCTTMAFATATETTVTTSNTAVPFADAEADKVATILRDLGILKGTENGADFAKTITRAEVVTTIVRALGYECEKTATKFTDVTADHWASGYIKKANELGWADGISAKEFNPDGLVTGYEVMAFIEKAIGYDQVHVGGTWPTNYSKVAEELGLYDTKKVPETAEAVKREYVFNAIFKALDKHLVQWVEASGNLPARFAPKTIAFTDDSVGAATLLSKVIGTPSEKVVTDVYTKAAAETVTTVKKYANGWTNKNFLGKNVNYIVNATTVVGIYAVNSKTLEGTFASNSTGTDLVASTFAGIKNTYDGSIAYFINGGYAGTTVPTFLTSKTAITAEVEYNKYTGDIAKIDSVFVASVGAIVKVTTNAAAKFDVEATKVAFTLNDASTLNLYFATEAATGKIDASKIELVGVDKFEDIDANAIVEVYFLSGDPTKTVSKLVVTQNVVLGKVTQKEVKSGKDYYTVGGTAYKQAAKTAQNWQAPSYAINYTSEFAFYLDKDGNYAAWGLPEAAEEKTPWVYAHVLNTTKAAVAGTGWNYDDANGSYEYKVRVLGLGETTAKEIVVSTAGLLSTNTDLGIGTLPQLIKYQVKGDMIVTMAAAGFTAKANLTPTSISVDNYRYADDVKIVVYNEGTVAKPVYATEVAYYAVKTAADVAGKAYPIVNYHRNTAGHVDYVVIEGAGTVGGTNTYATLAAIVGSRMADGVTYASILVDGVVSEVKSEAYYVYNLATYTNLYDLTFTAGKLVNASRTDIDEFAEFVTTAGLTVEANHVYATGAAVTTISEDPFNFGLDDKVVVLVWNATAKKYEASADLAAALEAATGEEVAVIFFDKDINGVADTVIIYSNYENYR